jgi:hypothetical protein
MAIASGSFSHLVDWEETVCDRENAVRFFLEESGAVKGSDSYDTAYIVLGDIVENIWLL